MGRRKKGLPINGWVNLNKPIEMSSSKAVAIVKRAFNAQKAGHAGTLDPLADGILPIALGEATKTVPFIQDASKTYHFTLVWGERRTTDDREGDVVETSDIRATQEQIEEILPQFTGKITQIPPAFSAIKIDGKRAYDIARASDNPDEIEIPSRDVTIHDLTLLTHNDAESTFRCHCGKGTYIRALARDIAAACGSVGYVGTLTREKVGDFSLESAILLDFFEQNSDSAALSEALLPVTVVLDDIPALLMTAEEASQLRQGQRLSFVQKHKLERLQKIGLEIRPDIAVIALALEENSSPIGLISVQGVVIKPERLFNV